jgi:hypothetical protein
MDQSGYIGEEQACYALHFTPLSRTSSTIRSYALQRSSNVEKRGKKWTQVKQDREWEDRDRWRFLCNSRPKKLETT